MSVEQLSHAIETNDIDTLVNLTETTKSFSKLKNEFGPLKESALLFACRIPTVSAAIIEHLLIRSPFRTADKIESLNKRAKQEGHTPLFFAARNGNHEVCRVLLEYGAAIHSHCVIFTEQEPDQGEQQQQQQQPESTSRKLLCTPLQIAAMKLMNGEITSNAEIFKYQKTCDLLLNYGADIEIWKTDESLSSEEQVEFIVSLCLSPAGLIFIARRPSLPNENSLVAQAMMTRTPTLTAKNSAKKAIEKYRKKFGNQKEQLQQQKQKQQTNTNTNTSDDMDADADAPPPEPRLLPGCPFNQVLSDLPRTDRHRFFKRLELIAEKFPTEAKTVKTKLLKRFRAFGANSCLYFAGPDTNEMTVISYIFSIDKNDDRWNMEREYAREAGLLPYEGPHPSKTLDVFMKSKNAPFFDRRERNRVVKRFEDHFNRVFPEALDEGREELEKPLVLKFTEKFLFSAIFHYKISAIRHAGFLPSQEEEEARRNNVAPKYPYDNDFDLVQHFIGSEEKSQSESGGLLSSSSLPKKLEPVAVQVVDHEQQEQKNSQEQQEQEQKTQEENQEEQEQKDASTPPVPEIFIHEASQDARTFVSNNNNTSQQQQEEVKHQYQEEIEEEIKNDEKTNKQNAAAVVVPEKNSAKGDSTFEALIHRATASPAASSSAQHQDQSGSKSPTMMDSDNDDDEQQLHQPSEQDRSINNNNNNNDDDKVNNNDNDNNKDHKDDHEKLEGKKQLVQTEVKPEETGADEKDQEPKQEKEEAENNSNDNNDTESNQIVSGAAVRLQTPVPVSARNFLQHSSAGGKQGELSAALRSELLDDDDDKLQARDSDAEYNDEDEQGEDYDHRVSSSSVKRNKNQSHLASNTNHANGSSRDHNQSFSFHHNIDIFEEHVAATTPKLPLPVSAQSESNTNLSSEAKPDAALPVAPNSIGSGDAVKTSSGGLLSSENHQYQHQAQLRRFSHQKISNASIQTRFEELCDELRSENEELRKKVNDAEETTSTTLNELRVSEAKCSRLQEDKEEAEKKLARVTKEKNRELEELENTRRDHEARLRGENAKAKLELETAKKKFEKSEKSLKTQVDSLSTEAIDLRRERDELREKATALAQANEEQFDEIEKMRRELAQAKADMSLLKRQVYSLARV